MIDFDALVLGPAQAAFGCPAVLEPVVSQPGVAPYAIRGIFTLKPADIVDGENPTIRADDYTFAVRASDFETLVARGDLVSEIQNPSFARFLEDRTFQIEDTGDDGQGAQTWVLKALDGPTGHPADHDA